LSATKTTKCLARPAATAVKSHDTIFDVIKGSPDGLPFFVAAL
jgi:hypothetical protein